jgi:hypothetical protein
MKFYRFSRRANLCLNELNMNSVLRKSFSQLARNQVLTIDARGGGGGGEGGPYVPSQDFKKFGQQMQ